MKIMMFKSMGFDDFVCFHGVDFIKVKPTIRKRFGGLLSYNC
jgi:hypothetical protein